MVYELVHETAGVLERGAWTRVWDHNQGVTADELRSIAEMAAEAADLRATIGGYKQERLHTRSATKRISEVFAAD